MVQATDRRVGPLWGRPTGFNEGTFNGVVVNGLDERLLSMFAGSGEVASEGADAVGVGEGAVGGLLLNAVFQDQPSISTTGEYRLELRTREGRFLSHLPKWLTARWVDAVNQPGSLEFTYFAAEDPALFLSHPNEVWLLRGRETTPRRVFVIQATEEEEEDERVLKVSCEGLLARFAKDYIRNYTTGGARSVANILADWLNTYQGQSPAISVGRLHPGIAQTQLTLGAHDKSILAALKELIEMLGGYMYVSPRRRLVWDYDIGYQEGHVIGFAKNATRINHALDYRAIETRLIATGKTIAGETLTVIVDDTAAQALYGIRTGYYHAPDVDVESQLQTLAENELARRNRPREEFQIGMIDLSHTDQFDYSFEALALEPGSLIRLVSKESGTNITAKVWQVTRDLADPMKVQMEVGDVAGGLGYGVSFKPKTDLLDALARLVSYVQRVQQSAV
ncbi:MAG: hypothetical protein GHCLOJNM_03058 [bacterium]|nr:hypothetical protein [bacterium]